MPHNESITNFERLSMSDLHGRKVGKPDFRFPMARLLFLKSEFGLLMKKVIFKNTTASLGNGSKWLSARTDSVICFLNLIWSFLAELKKPFW